MSSGHHAHVSANAHGVRQVADVLDAFFSAEKVPEDVAWRLRVAVDEVVSNVVAHGTAGGTVPEIEVGLRRDGDLVEITISDQGGAFNPLLWPAPDTTTPLDQRQPGGLGILLAKRLVDDVRYSRTTHNVITLRKRIP